MFSKLKLQEVNIKRLKYQKHDPPLDLITDNAVKDIEKQEFTSYFTTSILSALHRDPDIDITSIEIEVVDFKNHDMPSPWKRCTIS